MTLTAIIEETPDGWFVGQIKEFPAALSQGKTIAELKRNLIDSLQLLMVTNGFETEKKYSGKKVLIETLTVA